MEEYVLDQKVEEAVFNLFVQWVAIVIEDLAVHVVNVPVLIIHYLLRIFNQSFKIY